MVGLMGGAIHPDVIDDARLLVTELLSNSFRHPATAPREIVVDLCAGPDGLRAEVSDGGSGFSVPAWPSNTWIGSGRGLLKVESLADRWGVDIDHETTVWFEIDYPPDQELESGN
jgi:two-component sensor histidine kinase